MGESSFPFELEAFAATLAQLYRARGLAAQVALLAVGEFEADSREGRPMTAGSSPSGR